MLKSSGAMGAATMASRVLGLVREQVYAFLLGTTPVAGAFYFAFVIPNLFRRLLGEGALTAAFIPLFKEKEKTMGEEEMWRAANAVISGLVLFSAAVVVVVVAGVGIALATLPIDSETQLMLRLLQWMFPYMLFVCLGAAFMGMLNARGHFFIPALSPVLLNVAMIAAAIFIAPMMGVTLETQVFGLAIGVLVAGVAQAFFQLPKLRQEGYRYQWVAPWRDQTVREVVRKMVPGAIGVATFQINVVLTYGLAFGTNKSTVADFNYAIRLMELPQGVFGISLATFLLPALSALATDKKYDEFRSTLGQGISYLFLVNLLASVLLFCLAEPIIRLLFEHGPLFGPLSTDRVSFGLICLAPGLLAFSLVNILARAFYALGDVKTPMKISIVCLAINFIFAAFFLLQLRLGAGGLGLANTMSSIVNMSLLLFALRKKLKRLDLQALQSQFLPLATAAILAGLLASISSSLWLIHVGNVSVLQRLGEVFVPMILATAGYFGVALWMKIPSAIEMIGLIRKRLGV